MSDRKFSLQRLFNNNKFVLIISLILAFVIWIAYSMYGGEEQEKTISVPIKLDSMSVPEQFNLKPFGDYSNTEITVTVRGKKAIVGTVNSNDIVITASTINVNSAGKHSLPLSISIDSSKEFEIISSSVSTIEVYFDVNRDITSNVEAIIDGDYAASDGYELGEPILSSSNVTIHGPSTEISKISKVYASIQVNDTELTKTASYDAKVYAVDKYDNEIQNITIDGADTFKVTLPVYYLTTLPVTVNLANNPAGITIDKLNIKYSKASLYIGGDETALSDTESLNIGTIDFNDLSEGVNTIEFDVTELPGIILKDDVTVITATINLKGYDRQSISIDSSAITINNSSAYNVTFSEEKSFSVILIGDEDSLQEIELAGISASVNIPKDAELGDNQSYDIKISVVDNDLNAWVYGTYKIAVNISEA